MHSGLLLFSPRSATRNLARTHGDALHSAITRTTGIRPSSPMVARHAGH